MERFKRIIVGGGASGLMLAALCEAKNTVLLERGARVGRKLSATGNGQGNITHLRMDKTHYFSRSDKDKRAVLNALSLFGKDELIAFLEKLGGLFLADSKGRVYPTGRQASAITDLLRKYLCERGVDTRLEHTVTSIQKSDDGFVVTAQTPSGEKKFFAEKIVLCAGGKAAKNFGTDGNGFELCKKLGHGITALYPSLVQLKTDSTYVKPLKGIRIAGAVVKASYIDGKEIATETGDVIFTDYGVSGDAIFRLSAFLSDKIDQGVEISINLLPEVPKEKLEQALKEKLEREGEHPELLCGILNNQVGRFLMKRFDGNTAEELTTLVRSFTLPITGTLGYDYAQVTKGGVSLVDVDENLQSKLHKGLYFAGEILDVDGECGGYNLQWAFSSAALVAKAIGQGEK